ncbi:unnamed protein product [Gongylonema pulchrum]|uniref:C2H2-type domain-containing protein n=1 Tax=Gongylonema pulchrum TaxID=637853 RepID=A0A183DVS9_9BILA|nr:unnamed protein product [Gongylonema pulchrum]
MSVEQESAGKFTAIRLTENELKKGAGASFCEICSRTFANGNAYRFHRIKKHAIIGDERDLALFNCTPLSAGAERRYFCPASDCRYSSGRYFRAYKLLRQHFLKVHCEKQFSSRMPSAEKATQTSDGPVAACCHASSQTVQRSIPEFFPPVRRTHCRFRKCHLQYVDDIIFLFQIFHEQNDFHCQTRIASGVEFGTQISPEDVDSISVMQQQQQQQNAKTHDDFEFEDIWRHIETQTPAFTGNDVLTQTAIDFMDSASMTDWNLLIS